MAFAYSVGTNNYKCTFTSVAGDSVNILSSSEQGLLTLQKVASPGAAYDSEERNPAPRCHLGTQVAVLKKITEWAQSGSTPLLWLHGPAGAGKSAIAQSICESCVESGHLAASFFFSRGVPGRDSIGPLFLTIAYQLAICRPDKRILINNTVQHDPHVLNKLTVIQLRQLIIEPFTFQDSVSEMASPTSPTQLPSVIVIDGLDECKRTGAQTQILQHVFDLVHTYHLPLRFLIVSRPEPHIHRFFSQPTLQDITLAVSLLDGYRQLSDIELYLRSEFQRIHNSDKHSYTMDHVSKPWPSDDTIRLITDRSEGYFIYASTILNFIDEEYYHPGDRLTELMNGSAPGSAVFAELDKLYQQILSTHPNWALLKSILQSYMVVPEINLYQPFSCTHDEHTSDTCIREAILGLSPGQILSNLRGLHSIIDSDVTSGLRFKHASLLDFLYDPTRSRQYYIDPQICRTEVTKHCWGSIKNWANNSSHPWENDEYWEPEPHDMRSNIPLFLTDLVEDHKSDNEQLIEELRSINAELWEPVIHSSCSSQCCALTAALAMLLDKIVYKLEHLPEFRDIGDLIIQYKSIRDSTYRRIVPAADTDNWHIMMAILSIADVYDRDRILGTDALEHLLDIVPHTGLDDPANVLIDITTMRGLGLFDFMDDPTQTAELYIDPEMRHSNFTRLCMIFLSRDWGDALPEQYAYGGIDGHASAERYTRHHWVDHLYRSPYKDEQLLSLLQQIDIRRLFKVQYFDKLIRGVELLQTRYKAGLLKREDYTSDVWRPPWLHQQPWIFLNSFRDPYGKETWAWDDLDEDYPYRRMLARQDRQKTILVIKWLKKHPHPPQDIISHWEAYLFESFPETHDTDCINTESCLNKNAETELGDDANDVIMGIC